MVYGSAVETQLIMGVVFIAKTECFGPCTGPVILIIILDSPDICQMVTLSTRSRCN